MGYFLLGHGGSGDHGSEDRVRGICKVLPEQPELFTGSLEEDWRYGLGEVAGLNRHLPNTPGQRLQDEDWCVSLRPGFPDKLRKSGRAVLWGWMPGTEALPRSMVRRLRRYHTVIVPDLKSVKLLHNAGLRNNVRLGPDPTFLVDRQLRPLRGAFRKDTVGICFSPAAVRFEPTPGLLYHSYCHLIQWVLDNTPWQIALIPYCVKPFCNDELLLNVLNRQFCQTGRVQCRGDGDSRILRGDLSMCRCCVGTAGVLAAWSCGVPGLCIGSSIRARYLSRMMAQTVDTVVSAGSLNRVEDLTIRFQAFLRQEDVYRQRLERSAAECRRRAADWTWDSIA